MDELKYAPVRHYQKYFLEKASKRRGFNDAYDELEAEYAFVHEMLSARTRAGLTQEAVADPMGTSKFAGKHAPSVASLKKHADAAGCKLKIEFIPRPVKPGARVNATKVARRSA